MILILFDIQGMGGRGDHPLARTAAASCGLEMAWLNSWISQPSKYGHCRMYRSAVEH